MAALNWFPRIKWRNFVIIINDSYCDCVNRGDFHLKKKKIVLVRNGLQKPKIYIFRLTQKNKKKQKKWYSGIIQVFDNVPTFDPERLSDNLKWQI